MDTEIMYKSAVVGDEWSCGIDNFDFVFVAISPDLRAYEAISIAGKHNVGIKRLVAFNFAERKDIVKKKKNSGSENYKKLSFNRDVIECSIKDPSDALKKLNLEITEECNIAVDISFFTKPFYFTLLNWLKVVHNVVDVTIFYTEPKNYLFNKGLYNQYHSSFGPIAIEEIASFSGIDANKENSLLILLLGFDGDLSSEIDEIVAPKKTILINGFPSYSPNFKDISLIANEKIVNKGGNKLLFSRSTNPFDTYNLLDEIKQKEEYKGLFMNIAPIGTKPMSLGVCMFALHNPDVRVIYPMPEKFEDGTSRDTWFTWFYNITLS